MDVNECCSDHIHSEAFYHIRTVSLCVFVYSDFIIIHTGTFMTQILNDDISVILL